MSDDPLSDVLRLLQARSVISGGFAAGGTWGFQFPAPHQVVFSAIAKGSCWLRVEGVEEPRQVFEGDIGLLPGRRAFFLGSSIQAPPVSVAFENRNWGMDVIGDGSGCVVLAGRVSLDPTSARILTDVLPDVILVRAASPRAASLRWILEEILDERTSTVPGSSIVSAQLAQLLFVQILRAYLASGEQLPSGWLRATADDRLVRALRLMHDEPGRTWRLDELAKAAGMSRTRFAVAFSAAAGVAPLTYLTEWRMRLAERRLREDEVTVAELAASLGYGSESAFSTAFKRVTGQAPRDYRTASRLDVAGRPRPAERQR